MFVWRRTAHDIAMVGSNHEALQQLAIWIRNSLWEHMPFSYWPLVLKHMAQEVVA